MIKSSSDHRQFVFFYLHALYDVLEASRARQKFLAPQTPALQMFQPIMSPSDRRGSSVVHESRPMC
jgi:hypothetical protein